MHTFDKAMGLVQFLHLAQKWRETPITITHSQKNQLEQTGTMEVEDLDCIRFAMGIQILVRFVSATSFFF